MRAVVLHKATILTAVLLPTNNAISQPVSSRRKTKTKWPCQHMRRLVCSLHSAAEQRLTTCWPAHDVAMRAAVDNIPTPRNGRCHVLAT